MSAYGEFGRLVGRCIDFLEASESEAARSWAADLHAARAIACDDLSSAATRVLALSEASPSIEEIDHATARERDEFCELCDRMLAIARVIVGAPPPGSPVGR
jgi:hypothetical protein